MSVSSPGSRSLVVLLFALTALFAEAPIGLAQSQPDAEAIQKALATELPEDPSEVVAVVGQTPILAGELLPKIDRRIAAVAEKTNRPLSETEIHFGRVNMFRSLLSQTIQSKMMREAFLLNQVGTQAAEKREEVKKMMQTRARKLFMEAQVPRYREQFEVESLTEVDAKLREQGASLKTLEREFIDSMLGRMYLQEMIDQEPEVTLGEVQEYYNQHLEEYEQPARARWEQLTVRFDRFPSRADADRAIREMGNEALFGGNMQAVAKDRSQEPFASSGGVHDWTNRGSLASKILEEQIFQLPLNRMSEIIEDDEGFHIIRVTDRKPAGRTPIAELQDEITEAIRERKVIESEEKLLARMREQVPVWSVFPEDLEGARPLQRVADRGPTKQR